MLQLRGLQLEGALVVAAGQAQRVKVAACAGERWLGGWGMPLGLKSLGSIAAWLQAVPEGGTWCKTPAAAVLQLSTLP